MKLRNKRTGGLANIMGEQNFFRVYTDAGWEDYSSLAELNADWEDYEPAEPLIKNEKVRKAVRAMANITGVSMLYYEYYEDNETIQLSDMNGQILAFKSKKLSVKDLDSYTIDELCGEDEE